MQNLFSNKFSLASLGLLLLGLQLFQGCSTSKVEQEPLETLPKQKLILNNFQDFREVSGNWSIAGDVENKRTAERNLTGLEGTGILTNIPTKREHEHLFTSWNHGDLELELDFLMPKNSDSGIYLMGRYEVQLLDSWGVDTLQSSGVGGIYKRWDDSRPDGEEAFGGSAPRMNAARAPGLWQHLKILFKAPEFDQNGNKLSHAVFEEVWLNGVLIQENVEVSGPTREAAFKDEQPVGPLMIQGDHGPVAIRDIQFKRYDKARIHLRDLDYEYYGGEFDQIPEFGSMKADETGSVDSLSGSVVRKDDRYALRYSGTLEAPNRGRYLFKLKTAGSVRLTIDDEVIFEQNRPFRMHEGASKTIDLEEGRYSFELEYINHPNNWYRGLALFGEGPELRHQKFHASSSVPGGGRELPDLYVEADDRVKIIRSFAMHKGEKRTHVVNIGAPNGINVSYDMGQMTLLHAWEGPFINAKEMWVHRGEPQTAEPAGPPITFDGKPVLAELNSGQSVWPDSISWDQLKIEGYEISESGWPIFKYTFNNVRIEDRFEGDTDSRRLTRTVKLSSPRPQDNLWFQLASGKQIIGNETDERTNEYTIDDRTFYLKLSNAGGHTPQIVTKGDAFDLRLPVLSEGTEAVFKYDIIW